MGMKSLSKIEERKYPTWHTIDRAVAIALLRELASTYKAGDMPGIAVENIQFERASKYPVKMVAKELQLNEVIL